MICLGIALEAALRISDKQNGMCAYHSLTMHLLTPYRLLSTRKECIQLPVNPVPYGNSQYIVTKTSRFIYAIVVFPDVADSSSRIFLGGGRLDAQVVSGLHSHLYHPLSSLIAENIAICHAI